MRMEREATAFVTGNELSCETSLTTEYAPKVMRGDKTAGEKAADVSTCLPGVEGGVVQAVSARQLLNLNF